MKRNPEGGEGKFAPGFPGWASCPTSMTVPMIAAAVAGALVPATLGYIITTNLSTLTVNTPYPASGNTPDDGAGLPAWSQKFYFAFGSGGGVAPDPAEYGTTSLPPGINYNTGSGDVPWPSLAKFTTSDLNSLFIPHLMRIRFSQTPSPFTNAWGSFTNYPVDRSDPRGLYSNTSDGFLINIGQFVFVNGF